MKFRKGETDNVCALQISKLTWSYKHREGVLITQTKQIFVWNLVMVFSYIFSPRFNVKVKTK